MKPIDVCAAVVTRNDRYLLATRPPDSHLAGKWEFPGGKIHDGETPEECIRRELQEELGIHVRHANPMRTILHDYPDKRIRLLFMDCEIDDDAVPHGREQQTVSWFPRQALAQLDLAPADRKFVESLLQL